MTDSARQQQDDDRRLAEQFHIFCDWWSARRGVDFIGDLRRNFPNASTGAIETAVGSALYLLSPRGHA